MDINVTLDNGGGGNGTQTRLLLVLLQGQRRFRLLRRSKQRLHAAAPPGSVTLQMPAMTSDTAILRIVTG